MRMQHVASQQLARLRRRYPFLRRVTATTTLITLVWIYTLYWGERSTFQDHIAACDWSKWEDWPTGAAPHRLVFIADPQLVDPHTYPGRPWPLSTLTEKYTDMYMGRNFRLINEHLDPDSIVFLGDLFDGGREWAPEQAKPLKSWQQQFLSERGITADRGKSSWEAYKASTSKQPAQAAWQTDYTINEAHRTFRPGEKGRWSRWGQAQWDQDLQRFAKIFYAPEQLYPTAKREIFPAYELHDSIGVENGAAESPQLEYATSGGKQRRLIAGLPGNHDLGFGALVQLSVRDRFVSHFGESNRIDVIGNHTFVSIDAPSLSAHSQYMANGYESDNQQVQDVKHLWGESIDFLEDVRTPASKVVRDSLDEIHSRTSKRTAWHHDVIDPREAAQSGAAEESAIAKPKLPVVLLTHVPLYRPPDSECGKQREKGRAISISMGYQYQNVITQSLSRDIVTKVSGAGDIVHVFSGDDHDYCDVNHRYNLPPWPQSDGGKTTLRNIREITVKSFSWAMGVRKPGFQLVSLWNPVDAQGNSLGRTTSPSIQSHMCLLPDQLSTFIDYALLLLYTLPALLLRAVVLALRHKDAPEADSEPSTPTKTILPRFMPKINGAANGTANGYARPTDKFKERSGRHRASSTSTSSNANSSNNTLQVQRSVNARTRSVSPAPGGVSSTTPTPLIEKAGFFPAVRWHDPSDADDSDEESHVGTEALSEMGEMDDSQAKWKWRRRTPGRARRAVDEFASSLLVVGVPALLWYAVLIKNG